MKFLLVVFFVSIVSVLQADMKSNIVQKKFTEVEKAFKINSMSYFDKEHDKHTLMALKQAQESWLAYRDSQCQSEAMFYIFPKNSKLYYSYYTQCISALNTKRIIYLDNLLIELSLED